MKSFQCYSSRRSSQGSRRGSRDNLSEEEYAYVRHKAIPLDQLEKDSGRGSLVPDSCFQWKDVAIVEDDEEDSVCLLADLGKRGDTVHLAPCQRVGETGLLSPCHLLISITQLVVLLPGPRSGTVLPSSSRHLSSIVKITSKKRQPEIITFKVC